MRPPALPSLRVPRTGRPFTRSVALSAALHGVVVALLVWQAVPADSGLPRSPGEQGPLGGGGGASSERTSYLVLPPYRASTAPVAAHPATPDRVRYPTRVQIRDVPSVYPSSGVAPVSLVSVRAPTGPLGLGMGPGNGGGVGAGMGTGTGPGTGPGRGGAAGVVFPPQARYSILPPLPKPQSVRGVSFRVHFWVDVGGRVTRVEVSPPIQDADYRKKFLELMREYTFTPALRWDGTPVPGDAVLTITL